MATLAKRPKKISWTGLVKVKMRNPPDVGPGFIPASNITCNHMRCCHALCRLARSFLKAT
jgi:hypothetical protein